MSTFKPGDRVVLDPNSRVNIQSPDPELRFGEIYKVVSPPRGCFDMMSISGVTGRARPAEWFAARFMLAPAPVKQVIDPDPDLATTLADEIDDALRNSVVGPYGRAAVSANILIEARDLLRGYAADQRAREEAARHPDSGRVFRNRHGMSVRIGDDGHAYWLHSGARMWGKVDPTVWTERHGGR